MKNLQVTIVGGGIAGLASAIGLHSIGHQVSVHEQSREFAEVGAGLQLGPNAVRALEVLGLWSAVSTVTHEPRALVIRDGVNGRTLKRIPLATFEQLFGMPYRVAKRSDLHRVLLNEAQRRGIQLTTLHRVEEVPKGDAVVIADGVNSTLRQKLFRVPALSHNLTHYRAMGQTDLMEDAVTLWLCPGAHVVHYPVGEPRQLNVVVAVEGVSTLSRPDQFLASCANELKELVSNTTGWSQWPALTAPALSTWHKDHAVLIGDAAHATLPYLAQGAAMALEDAAELRVAFAVHNDVQSAFQIFEKTRRQRAQALQLASHKMRRIYHAADPLRLARNLVIEVLPQQLFLSRQRWIYDWRSVSVPAPERA